ncbi:hypothetical protein [Pedobacter sp. V48]|uniref:hypothetical protein n=1 Tax=Pedobacter sp. V48 TaxID=509635 RepID=UPI001267F308|nr:hypothetical protein [Pedobacter sp. V48]
MLCRLCLQEKPLLKKSHIIPNFMYKGIFGKDHKVVNVSMDNLKKVSSSYTGIYDRNILCAECDNEILSKLETYASSCIFFNGNPKTRSHIKLERLQGGELVPAIRFHNLDYTRTKLFFLSLLWRAHISTNKFFEVVALGNYAEKIRKMLVENNAGKEDEFEVILMHIDSDGTRPDRSIISPRHFRIEGNSSYMFHINEIMYHFNISGHNKLSLFETGIIKKDGILDIMTLTDSSAREHFDMFMGKKILMKSNIRR